MKKLEKAKSLIDGFSDVFWSVLKLAIVLVAIAIVITFVVAIVTTVF